MRSRRGIGSLEGEGFEARGFIEISGRQYHHEMPFIIALSPAFSPSRLIPSIANISLPQIRGSLKPKCLHPEALSQGEAPTLTAAVIPPDGAVAGISSSWRCSTGFLVLADVMGRPGEPLRMRLEERPLRDPTNADDKRGCKGGTPQGGVSFRILHRDENRPSNQA